MPAARQHPLFVFLVHMTQSILLRQIAYLKAENAILWFQVGGWKPLSHCKQKHQSDFGRVVDVRKNRLKSLFFCLGKRGWVIFIMFVIKESARIVFSGSE